MSQAIVKPVRSLEALSYWQGLIREWEASGQTRAAFCRSRQLSYYAFMYWQSAWVRRRSARAAGSGFVEVKLPVAMGTGRYKYELGLSGGRALRLSDDFDPGTVSRLMSLLERSC